MHVPLNITASSVIINGQCFKNGEPVFNHKAADLPGFLTAVYLHLGLRYPKFYKMDHLSKLGLLGTELLLRDSFKIEKYQPEEIGVVLSNASSSLDADIRYYESVNDIASPALFVYTLPNIVIGEISIKHNFKGENAFFIFEKFDAGFIEKYVSGLIGNNILQGCICGWTEVIGEQYEAVLFLVEKQAGGEGNTSALAFTTENLNHIYHSYYG